MLRAGLDQVARRVPEFLYTLDERNAQLAVTVGEHNTVLLVPALDSVSQLTELLSHWAAYLDDHLDNEVERAAIEYALLNGMLSTLDPHSVFIPPDDYKEMRIQNKGHFGGLGITIGIREQRLTVLYPLKDTPAWRAGLKAGDRIDRIGNESTVNMSLQEAVSLLRGEEGTPVTITVSDNAGPDREVTITRARIEVPSVGVAYAGDGVGLIQLFHFSEATVDKVEDALSVLEKKAIEDKRGRLHGLILDLRQNPGGYLRQAIEVADKFLRSGVIVTTAGLGGSNPDITRATRFSTEDDLPVVVLVDQASASASEIVAGALRNQDRAVVMGVRTFGKGSVQNLYDREFPDGALKLTIAQYLTPGDESIQGVGVQPDIELRPALVKKNDDGQPEVRLYWQDFELREENLDQSFADWAKHGQSAAELRSVYSSSAFWEDENNLATREATAEDSLKDLEVLAAKALLLARPSASRSEMLKEAPRVLDRQFGARERELSHRFADLEIDWSNPPGAAARGGKPTPATVELRVGGGDEALVPGTPTPVTLTVTNTSRHTLHRLRAVTEGEFFRGREYFFGKLAPNETKSFSVSAEPALWLQARVYEVNWQFFTEGGPAPEPFTGRLRIEPVPHPRFAYSWQIIDDGSGQSHGNGDGLIQPGEAIDLLVSVRNTGKGATSGLWQERERGLTKTATADGTDGEAPAAPAEGGGAEAGDGDAAKTNTDTDTDLGGFIRLRNKAGKNIFLVKGSDEFALEPGAESDHRLHFRVDETAVSEAVLEAELMVGDRRFYEFVSTDLELPLYSPSDPIAAMERNLKPKSGQVWVRGGASERSEIVGWAEGPLTIDGRLGSWVRTALPWGGSGWLESKDLVPARRTDSGEGLKRQLSNSPPVIDVAQSLGGSVVVSDQISVEGTIVDDRAIKDLFVFVNNRKVTYERFAGEAPTYPFQLKLDLDPGENLVEIFARDAQGHLGNFTFGLYRETTTAAIGKLGLDSSTLR